MCQRTRPAQGGNEHRVTSGCRVAASPAVGRGGAHRTAVAGDGASGNARLLRGLVPAVEAFLQLLGGGFGRLGAVDHVGRGAPGLVLEIGRAARQDLVGRADRRLALARARRRTPGPADPPASPASIGQAEEARQRVGIDVGELRRCRPIPGTSWPLPALGGLRVDADARCRCGRRCSRCRRPSSPAAGRRPS